MPPMSDDPTRSLKARVAGVVFLGIGVLFVKIGVVDVLAQARATSAPVTTYIKVVVIAPMFIALGLLLLVIGAPSEPKPGSLVLHLVTGHGPQSRLEPLGYALVLVFVALGLGLHAWLVNELASLGYE